MKSQLSLSELARELETRAAQKADYSVITRNMAMQAEVMRSEDGSHGPTQVLMHLNEQGKTNTFNINDLAHSQLAGRLGIPGRYYGRMRQEAPQLLADNVNTWLQGNPERRMVRTLGSTMRAFLSDRYQRIENEEIANVVLPQLLDQDVRIESCAITETRMYIKAVFPKIQGEVAKGDVVQAGIVISNSEVGQGAVKIQPLVFRLVCLNGMIIEDSKYTARHVGGRISGNEEIIELLSNEALQADDRAVLLKVRDVVRASFDAARFAQRLEQMQGATADVLEGNPVEAVKLLSHKFLLNEFEQGSVLRHLIQGGDTSRWGVLNAVTRTAQDVEDYDRATELETLGGNILHMPAPAWRELAVAA